MNFQRMSSLQNEIEPGRTNRGIGRTNEYSNWKTCS